MGTPQCGDRPAQCSPTPGTAPAPLPWPEVLVHPRLGAWHPLMHTWHPLPHGTVRSSGEMVPDEPSTGTSESCRVGDGQPSKGMG